MDRPKLDYVSVSHDRNKLLKIEYSFKPTENTPGDETIKCVEFSNDSEYQDFLEEKDFSEVEIFQLLNNETNESVNITENDPPYDGFDLYYFRIDGDKETFLDLGFEGTCYNIEMKSNTNMKTPYYDSYLKSLREMGFFENNGSKLIAVKIIMDRLTGNSNLKYNGISVDSERPLHMDISECLFKYNFFNFESRCNGRDIYIAFDLDSTFTILEKNFYSELMEKVNSRNYSMEKIDDDKEYFIEISMNCQKCKKEHSNRITFYRNNNILEIIIC
uniref:DUF5067 domain-containing protein n=1 Tax=Strongyloides papillosus TaxID=174720 RepID=A0A0N5BFY0_STREA